jgi:hypothetical protein
MHRDVSYSRIKLSFFRFRMKANQATSTGSGKMGGQKGVAAGKRVNSWVPNYERVVDPIDKVQDSGVAWGNDRSTAGLSGRRTGRI